ncbi:GNAT family N-acetyltransferase [Pararhodobacter zhoushanensis]|uniref:L-ornithine N(alpha)-acyltransferase n=1 Tax=Pararhodobacter zhoushanensis TaxID=2479545 RepID=A0ABT3H0B1_9RHOB|nr:GNAT family N-acyltransferase [Pararhodobacter zhoushanensis]MCW1933251.1 GNAT family N-acetyltransferase [Pararhodobacter zhoushanensis]
MSSPQHRPEHSMVFGAPISAGALQVRLADAQDMPALLDLRARAFRRGAQDVDSYDADSLHLWVGAPGGAPRATLRLRRHGDAGALLSGYVAQHYDLHALAAKGGESLELGRLCTEPGAGDADLLRLLWAGVARLALQTGAARLVGCTSFHTTEAATLDPAWALLASRNLGPADTRPGRIAPELRGFEAATTPAEPGAAALLPPLLRAYLALGGWVSDHAVIDRDLGTCHVFTCVEIDRLPEGRKRALAQMAGTALP